MTPAELKSARERLGLTQQALADKLAIPVNTIARWERGELTIGQPRVLALAIAHLSCKPRRSRSTQKAKD